MKLLVIILIVFTQSVLAQNKIKPVVEVGYSELFTDGYFARNLSVGLGVKVNEHFYFQVNFSQEKSKSKSLYQKTDFYRNQTIYLSTLYKLLSDDYIVSPVLSLGFGTEVKSNARGKIVESNLFIQDTYLGQPQLLYNKGKIFGKIKLQADIKLWDFNLLIGGGYSYFRINVDYLKPEYIGNDLVGYSINENRIGIMNISGWSLDASLRYTLNFGK